MTIMLATTGAIVYSRNAIVNSFTNLVIVSIVIVFIAPSWAVLLWSYIPGLSHTRHLSILATPISIGLAVLSAFGVKALTIDEHCTTARWFVFTIALIVLGSLNLIALPYNINSLNSIHLHYAITGIAALTFLLCAVLSLSSIALGLCCVATRCQRILYEWSFLPYKWYAGGGECTSLAGLECLAHVHQRN